MEIVIVKFSVILMCLNIILPVLIKVLHIPLKINILSCGLVGYCGETPADPNILRVLLMYNMDRGEDSTGWAINNIITKDTKKVSEFLAQNQLTISQDDENFSVICHARKSSSGAKHNKALAHPFGMYRGGDEKERYDLILAMNGTLSLVDEYCKEFNLNYIPSTNSDTQMLAKIMCELGERDYIRALEKYAGTATLLFMSPKYTNTLMVYKDPERPLFYWQKEKNQIYVSSLKESFEALGAKVEDVFSFPDSKVTRMNKGKITKTISIDRTNIIKYVAPKYASRGSYNDSEFVKKAANTTMFQAENDKECTNVGRGAHENRKIHSVPGNRIYLYCDKYQENGHAITGLRYVNDKGETYSTKKDGYTKRYYFFGYECKSEEKYKELFAELGKGTEEVDIPKFKVKRISELVEYFKYPVTSYINDDKTIFRWILNEEWTNKLKDDKVEIDFFLSNALIQVKDTKKKTSGNLKTLCEEFMVRLKSSLEEKHEPALTSVNTVLDRIKDRFTTNESKKEITRRLVSGGINTWPTDLLNDIKINFWYANNSADVIDYYYDLLFQIFHDCNIAESIELDLVYNSLVKNPLNPTVLKEVQLLQNIYVKYKASLGNRLNSESSETFDLRDKLNSSTSLSKSTIGSIEIANSIYSQESFKRDVYNGDYRTFNDLKNIYVSEAPDTSEIQCFTEAVGLALLHIGKLPRDCFNRFLENPKDLRTSNEICSCYYNFVTYIKDKQIDEVVGSSKASSDEDDVEEGSPDAVEVFDAKNFQDEIVGSLLDTMNRMEEDRVLIEEFGKDNDLLPETLSIKAFLEGTIKNVKDFIKLKSA